jgi:hypothetical protein
MHRRDASFVFGDAVAPFYSTTSRSSRGGNLATQQGSEADDREVGGIQHNFSLIVCENSEATRQIALERRLPALRHASRIHRVNLDWVYEAFQYPGISQRYVRNISQVADVPTKRFVERGLGCLVDRVFLAWVGRSFVLGGSRSPCHNLVNIDYLQHSEFGET